MNPSHKAAGTYSLTATYSGDTTRAGATSPELSQVVQRAATHLDDLKVTYSQLWTVREVSATLRGPRNEPIAGQMITFGTDLTTSAGYRVLCRAVTSSAGVARCTVPRPTWRARWTPARSWPASGATPTAC